MLNGWITLSTGKIAIQWISVTKQTTLDSDLSGGQVIHLSNNPGMVTASINKRAGFIVKRIKSIFAIHAKCSCTCITDKINCFKFLNLCENDYN